MDINDWIQPGSFEALLQQAPDLKAGELELLTQEAMHFAKQLRALLATPLVEDSPKQAEKLDFLNRFAVFGALNPTEKAQVAQAAELLSFSKGECVLMQGAPLPGLYFFLNEVEVALAGQIHISTRTGIFGASTVLAAQGASLYTLTAANNCQALLFPQPALGQLLIEIDGLYQSITAEIIKTQVKDLQKLHKEFSIAREQARMAQEILDRMGQASLALDEKGEIGRSFSPSAVVFLGHEKLAGRPLADLLLKKDRRALKDYYRAMHMLFEEEANQELVLQLLPKRVEHLGRHFALHYSIANDQQGTPMSLLLCLEDLTKELQLKALEEAHQQQEEEEKEIIGNIQANISGYLSLISLCETAFRGLSHLLEVLMDQGDPDPAALADLMRKLHGIKGFSSPFGFPRLRNAVHALEEALQGFQGGKGHLERLETDFMNFEAEFQYVFGFQDRLGDDFIRLLKGVNFSQVEFAVLLELLNSGRYEELREQLVLKVSCPAHAIAEGWEQEIETLAEKLGKKVKLWVEPDEGANLFQHQVKTLNYELRHLYRNSVDHGIESPRERLARGKNERGNIWLRVKNEKNRVLIILRDDGAGLDLKAIEQIARNKPLVDQKKVDELIRKGEQWRILFLPGFSSKSETTQISGRGVGLDAVHQCIEEMGGKITLVQATGEGCQFTLKIPKPV